MSLKAKIRNIAKARNLPAQVILQNYMFERLLVRLSKSPYKDNFVLKGGMLVAAIVGLDNRATMDLDTTLKKLPLTPVTIEKALKTICSVSAEDGVSFEVGTISSIREDDIYGGYRVALNSKFDTILTPLTIDISIIIIRCPCLRKHREWISTRSLRKHRVFIYTACYALVRDESLIPSQKGICNE